MGDLRISDEPVFLVGACTAVRPLPNLSPLLSIEAKVAPNAPIDGQLSRVITIHRTKQQRTLSAAPVHRYCTGWYFSGRRGDFDDCWDRGMVQRLAHWLHTDRNQSIETSSSRMDGTVSLESLVHWPSRAAGPPLLGEKCQEAQKDRTCGRCFQDSGSSVILPANRARVISKRGSQTKSDSRDARTTALNVPCF